jgi:protein AbiQ
MPKVWGDLRVRFFTVSDEYIGFLQGFDGKVPNNNAGHYKNQKVYVGVVFEIANHKFLAPLTSYKQTQDKISSSACSAFKLHERTNPDNKLGMISFNYMIPVIDSEIHLLDLEAQADKYKKMLYLQFEFIKTNRDEIILRAQKLYEHVVVKRTNFYVRISCDIPRLVDEYKGYKPQ